MKVRFVYGLESGYSSPAESIEYSWRDVSLPRQGEFFYVDGSDPCFPEGTYEVALVTYGLDRKGVQVVEIQLARRGHTRPITLEYL